MDCSLPGSSVHWESPGKDSGVGYHALLQGIFPTKGSNPGLLHCGRILCYLSQQGSPRILEWVAYPFSRGSPALQVELPGNPLTNVLDIKSESGWKEFQLSGVSGILLKKTKHPKPVTEVIHILCRKNLKYSKVYTFFSFLFVLKCTKFESHPVVASPRDEVLYVCFYSHVCVHI